MFPVAGRTPVKNHNRLTRGGHFWYCAIIFATALLALMAISTTVTMIVTGEVMGQSTKHGPIHLLGTAQDSPFMFYENVAFSSLGSMALSFVCACVVIDYCWRIRSDRKRPMNAR